MTENKPKFLKWFGAILVVALVFGFAAPSVSHAADPVEQNAATVTVAATSPEEEINDPLESMNRAIFDFNEVLQDTILRPLAQFYNETVNVTVRQGISNFLDNLSTPVILANDLLQGELERALKTFIRAFVNSTIGIGGIADIAGELGLERHEEDFGQTLAVYGVGEGFYLVLPVFGPSSPRDAFGKLVIDSYLDPLVLWLDNTDRDEIRYTLAAAKGLDEYAGIVDELNQVKKTSVDYYAAIRSLYRQKRKTEILNGSTLELPPIPDLSYNAVPEDFDQPLAVVNQPSQN
ncbi:MAG: VacJ family lipoprotein [Rhodospirillales bacterium]